VPAALLAELGEPLMSSTLLMPGAELPLSDPDEIMSLLGGRIDLFIDSGNCGVEPSTVVDLTGDAPVVLRRGKGATTVFD
jgi:tRNA A37 threonylcarbamoyladenosine synthetase subunit TsaC/SUA5/YrdC